MITTFLNPSLYGKKLALLCAFIIALSFRFDLFAHPATINKEHAGLDLKIFEGSYQMVGNQDLYLKITAYGTDLTLKELWSNREISFKQKSDLSFVATDNPDFTLDFSRDQSGTVNQVIAFKKDVWVKVKPKENKAKLSAAEADKLNKNYEVIFNAFQEAINGDSNAKIQLFLKTYMDEKTLATLTLADLTNRATELYQNTGGIERDTQQPINLETGTAIFKGKRNNNLLQMSVTLNPAGKIVNFGLKD